MKIRLFDNLVKILCIPMVGFIMTSSLSGCMGKVKEEDADQVINIENTEIAETLTEEAGSDNLKVEKFDVGEHIVAIPISNPTEKNIQYEYHEGYKPVGISTSAWGIYAPCFYEGYILYQNECPVECDRYSKSYNGEIVYTDFGTPIDFESQNNNSDLSEDVFEPGEHIISIPINSMSESYRQIAYYEGYEVAGIATSSFGKYYGGYGGGCILYVNKETVKCERDIYTKQYTNIGTPIELSKSLTK